MKNLYFLIKLLENGFVKCQIARRAWFWHVASDLFKFKKNVLFSLTYLLFLPFHPTLFNQDSYPFLKYPKNRPTISHFLSNTVVTPWPLLFLISSYYNKFDFAYKASFQLDVIFRFINLKKNN